MLQSRIDTPSLPSTNRITIFFLFSDIFDCFMGKKLINQRKFIIIIIMHFTHLRNTKFFCIVFTVVNHYVTSKLIFTQMLLKSQVIILVNNQKVIYIYICILFYAYHDILVIPNNNKGIENISIKRKSQEDQK